MAMRMNTKFESSEAQDALTPDYRKSNRRGSALRPQQAKSKDEQWLVDFLANLGIEISKESFGELTDTCTSAPEVLTKLLEESDAKLAPKDKVNVLVALLELSHRWYPDWVCEENLDDLMQEGYKQFDRWGRSGAGESLPAWERTWAMAKKLKDIWGLTSVFDFDRRFSGMQYLSNWIQDYEMELLNAVVFKAVGETAHDDFVRECVREFLPEDIHKIVHLTVDEDGNVVRDELDEYGNWVNDPWDGEEDNPWDDEDAAKYEALNSGDYVPMASLGMGPEDMPKPRPKPVTTKKIGRNEPCPCGSGKKYKKCCGRGV